MWRGRRGWPGCKVTLDCSFRVGWNFCTVNVWTGDLTNQHETIELTIIHKEIILD